MKISVEAKRCQLDGDLYEVLKSDWVPDKAKLKIREFILEWKRHVEFQTRVLKQLKSEQPLLHGFFPVVDPRMLEEIEQRNTLEFEYADRLPALVPSDEWEEYKATNRFLERHILRGPNVPSDWLTTMQMFWHNWKLL